MSNDVRRSTNDPKNRNQNEQGDQKEIPGDSDAADIVGRTGEEMAEVRHDSGDGEHPHDSIDPTTPTGVRRKPGG